MPGEAETRVKHTWEVAFQGTDPLLATTRDSPGFSGFYNHWSGKSHPTWKVSRKGGSALAPSQGP